MKELGLGSKLLKRRESLNIIPIVILFAFLIAILFFNATYKRVYVVGSSMEDTLYGAPGGDPSNPGGDFVYVFNAKPDRGDIVVIRTEDKTLIKRVIAVGGDKVEITRGKVYLNGVELDEPYVSEDNNNPILNNYPETTVEKGYVFFLGDNRDISKDSRSYGCYPVESVIGVVADWSISCKKLVTAINTFFEFTLPSWFGIK
ncbi:MAG: signal peptidase I [Candidatus Coproplasma sp.]